MTIKDLKLLEETHSFLTRGISRVVQMMPSKRKQTLLVLN